MIVRVCFAIDGAHVLAASLPPPLRKRGRTRAGDTVERRLAQVAREGGAVGRVLARGAHEADGLHGPRDCGCEGRRVAGSQGRIGTGRFGMMVGKNKK